MGMMIQVSNTKANTGVMSNRPRFGRTRRIGIYMGSVIWWRTRLMGSWPPGDTKDIRARAIIAASRIRIRATRKVLIGLKCRSHEVEPQAPAVRHDRSLLKRLWMNAIRMMATIGDKSSMPKVGRTRRIGARIGSVIWYTNLAIG